MKTLVFAVPAMLIALPAAAQVMNPTEYVATAGAGDLYEITSSQAVLETSADAAVRQFARMMIAHHTRSTLRVKTAAARARVAVPPPALTPLQSELVAELRAENGPARDAAYLAQQKVAHGQALDVQKAYAMEGTAPALKAAANAIVPVVQTHLATLMKM